MERRTTSKRKIVVFAALFSVFTLIFVPLRSAPSEAESTQDVRTRLLGPGWDEPGEVRIKWCCITTWLASFGGHVVLFDSTVMDFLGSGEPRATAMSLEDVIAAKPEYIFQNHVHLDQMRHAAYIATETGAVVVGAEEHCNFVKRDAMVKGYDADKATCALVRDSNGKPFTGMDSYGSPVSPPIYTPWGEIGKPESAPDGLEVTVVNIKHTQMRPYPDSLEGSKGHVVDLSPYQKSPPSAESVVDFSMTQDYEGGNLLYLIRYGDFSLIHHGSSGSLDPLEPGQAEIKRALRSLGAEDQIDVEIGGIAELQNYANGLIDGRRYAEEIGAKVFFPNHHGNWNPPATSDAHHYYVPWKEEMAKIDPSRRPDLCFVVEQTRNTSFGFTATEWAGDAKGTITPLGGPDCYTG